MKIFAEVNEAILSLLPKTPDKTVSYREELCAEDGEKNEILFRSDTAYELGGSGKPAVSGIVFSDSDSMVDEVLLYGKDLDEIKEDSPFAHITFVGLNQKNDEDINCEQLKNIGFTLFQLYPKGYHIRISPSTGKEQVRVAKSVLQENDALSFLNVGCNLIREFKKHENVDFVKTVFITQPDFDYRELSVLAEKAKKITDAVQSTLQLDSLDCASCKMKPICDEVDGLRELHFKKEKEKIKNGT